jgi:hypothetical protein
VQQHTRAAQDNSPGLENIGPLRDEECERRVLLYEQHGHPAGKWHGDQCNLIT